MTKRPLCSGGLRPLLLNIRSALRERRYNKHITLQRLCQRWAKPDRFRMRETSVGSSDVPEHANQPIDFILAKFPRIHRVFDILVQLLEPDAVHFLRAAIGSIDMRTRENHHSANVKIAAASESTQLVAQQSDSAQEHFHVGLLHRLTIERQFPGLINSDQSNPAFGLDREKTGGAKNDMLEGSAAGIQIMEDKNLLERRCSSASTSRSPIAPLPQ